MDARQILVASAAALLPIIATGGDATAAAIAALEQHLGKSSGLEVQEVRVTSSGVSCIEYRVNDAQGGKRPEHAVVRGTEVLRSTSGDERFQKEWDQHCLGPRGGISGGE